MVTQDWKGDHYIGLLAGLTPAPCPAAHTCQQEMVASAVN